MRKRQEKQIEEMLEMIRHDLRMRDFDLVSDSPASLQFHVVATADDLREEDIPSYITVRSEVRSGLWACETDPEAYARAVEDDRICYLSEEDVQAFLDIVEEVTDGRVTTYEACDDGIAYRVNPGRNVTTMPDFVAVEEVVFSPQSFSAITSYAYVHDTLVHWHERREQYLAARQEDAAVPDLGGAFHRPDFSFPFSPKKNLPS